MLDTDARAKRRRHEDIHAAAKQDEHRLITTAAKESRQRFVCSVADIIPTGFKNCPLNARDAAREAKKRLNVLRKELER